MAITPIAQDEFPGGETLAVSDLKEGTGIKFPCRWRHSGKYKSCSGMAILRHAVKGRGHTTTFRCKDGTLYVWRVA